MITGVIIGAVIIVVGICIGFAIAQGGKSNEERN